jgi:hypothetical protein
MVKKSTPLSNIQDIISRVNSNITGKFSRTPEPIVILSPKILKAIGDDMVHISEFIVAKVKGLIPDLNSHFEITDDINELPRSKLTGYRIN